MTVNQSNGAFPQDNMAQPLEKIFSENVLAKILRVAVEALNNNVITTGTKCLRVDTDGIGPSNRVSGIRPSKGPFDRPLCPPRIFLLDLRLLPGTLISPPRTSHQIPLDLSIPRAQLQPRPSQSSRPAPHPLHQMDRPHLPHVPPNRHPRSRLHPVPFPPTVLGTHLQRLSPARFANRRPKPRLALRPLHWRNPQLGLPRPIRRKHHRFVYRLPRHYRQHDES